MATSWYKSFLGDGGGWHGDTAPEPVSAFDGPWRVETDGRTMRILADESYFEGVEVAMIRPTKQTGLTPEEAVANARLIVAAPDLRDALSALYDACVAEEDGGVDEDRFMGAMKAAEMALKRAKGER